MKYVDLFCAWCDAPIKKAKNEYNRRVKLGKTKFYCNESCSSKHSNQLKPRTPSEAFLSKRKIGSDLDKYSPFRWYMRSIQRRKAKRGSSDIDLEYLFQLWEGQNGICPLTGWKLSLPYHACEWSEDNPFAPKSASLDRIDSSKGYLKGNVRFIAVIANYARNKWTDTEVIDFATAVVENAKTKATGA